MVKAKRSVKTVAEGVALVLNGIQAWYRVVDRI